MKKIVILGASGEIGRRAAKILKQKYHVKGTYFSRKIESCKNCEYFKIDVTNEKEIMELCKGADVIVNCAGASYINGRKIAEIASILQIPYIDPSGETFLEKYLYDKTDNNIFVLSSGYYPGLSGVLMKYVCNSFERPETVSGFTISEEVPSQSAIEDFVLTNLSGFGKICSYYSNGEVLRDTNERMEIVHNRLYKLQNYLSVEIKRIAEQFSLKTGNWYNVSFGDDIINKLQEAIFSIKLGQEVYKKKIADVVQLFETKQQQIEPFTYLEVIGTGRNNNISQTINIKVESLCSSILSAIIVSTVAEIILNERPQNGIYYAMDIIKGDKLLDVLEQYGVEVYKKTITEERVEESEYDEGCI